MNPSHVVLDADGGDLRAFLSAWMHWRAAAAAPQAVPASGDSPGAASPRLHYLLCAQSLPPLPPSAPDALRALWPLALPGFHRIVLDEGLVTLDLLIAAPEQALAQLEARVHAFRLPPGDFGATHARALARLAVQGATLEARAPDEASAWALASAGFACTALPAVSDSPESPGSVAPAEPNGASATDLRGVFASRKPQPAAPPGPLRRAVVIGAGLAGSAICQRLCARGWEVTLIERHAGVAQEASGNLAGIFMPLLSKDDNIPTRLSRAAYLFALREWRRMGGVGKAFSGAACGVLQLARDAGHARVQQEVLAHWGYPREYARWLDAQDAGALLGAATPDGGWLFPQGGWAHPASLCQAMLDQCGARLQRIFHAETLTLERDNGNGEWLVRGTGGALLAQAPNVILANGTGARSVAQAAPLPLSALRGQVTHLDADGAPALPLVVCREAYITPPSNGIVSAGATYDADADPALRADSQQENLRRMADIVGAQWDADAIDAFALKGRVGFRCAAPDRLPLVGALPDYPSAGRLERLRDVPRHPGLYGLLGYASRGLIWAPLMAELLLAQLENTPLPLEASLAAALDPGRFLLKERRRSQ